MDCQHIYRLFSVKQTERFVGTREDAIDRAMAIEEEYQPAYGVTVEDVETAETVADIRDGINICAEE